MMAIHIRALAVVLLACLSSAARAEDRPPHLDRHGLEAYSAYRQALGHKAFAIAPGGAWAWRGELSSADAARRAVLADCRRQTAQQCFPYAVDDRVVFDRAAWERAWGPYPDRGAAGRAPVGVARGQRFPDLAMTRSDGRRVTLSHLRGKVVVLHFWGSWCPHCVNEMPDLQRLHGRFARSREVAFVLMPVREAFSRSRKWAGDRKLRLPLYDGGTTVTRDHAFRLADGGLLADREVARVFPSTYVLDKHGIVLFAHTGPVADWMEYETFLKDAAERSGK